MIPQLSMLDFYRVCRDGVRYFPESKLACMRLNAWRVLHHDPRLMLEIGTDTLGAVPADRTRPFFWSQYWEQNKFAPAKIGYRYPIATAFEIMNETNGNGNVFAGNASRTHTIEFSVLDIFKPKTEMSDGDCDSRPINQIFLDTELLLDTLMRWIGGTVIAKRDNDIVPKIYNQQMLEALHPNQYNVVLPVGSVWASKNPKMVFSRVEYPAKGIYGTKCRFTFISEKCPTIEFNYNVPDPELIGFEAGCKNC